MSEDTIFFILYYFLGIVTVCIGAYRSAYNKQSIPAEALDTIAWFLLWWIYLPIFLIRYIKYKIKGRSI